MNPSTLNARDLFEKNVRHLMPAFQKREEPQIEERGQHLAEVVKQIWARPPLP